jgi:deazaflavin-dependent oxidoreductase (nitroreductase family)
MNVPFTPVPESGSDHASQGAPTPVQPVGPALLPRLLLGPLTKRINPLMVKRAGQAGFGLAAQIRHVGRRSGRAYVTPVTVRRDGEAVMIGLTFGNQSDWARNVMAAGHCTLRIDGHDYLATSPQLVDAADAEPFVRSAFTSFERLMMRRVFGIRQFMRLTIAPTTQDE